MTDSPPPETAPIADTPAKAARKTRTRLQAAAFFGGIATAIILALLVLGLVGGRMYLLSDSGRALV